MPQYIDVFLAPVRDNQSAQVATVALLVLMLADVVFGSINALVVQKDFSSHAFRAGLVRKMGNLGMMLVADVLDAMLLGGLELGFQPVYLAVAVALALMEAWSLVEIFAEMHPELADTELYRMLLRSKDGLGGKEGS